MYVHWSQSTDYAHLWHNILRRHQDSCPEFLLSLDFHKVCDRQFWQTVRVFDLLHDRPSIAVLVLSYTRSDRLAAEARSYISRIVNCSRHRGPVVLCITPSKVGPTGKQRCLRQLIREAPQQLRGVTHIDDSEDIIEEITSQNTAGIQGRLFEVNNRWPLPAFLQYYGLL